ncbi:MAG: 3'-5' exonuclease, partial [Acidimicrobiia bacterium]
GLSGRVLLVALAQGPVPIQGQGSQALKARATQFLEILPGLPESLTDQIKMLFDPDLSASIEDEEKRRWVARDLGLLREAANELATEHGIDSLASVMNRLRYRIATRTPLTDQPRARVQIMTLHSAKGLEGDAIVVSGLAHQMIPGFAEDNEHEREEQRRLLYVAVTRAREELILSWPRSVKYVDAMTNNIARSGGIVTVAGERLVRLSKTAFLPATLPAPEPGDDWIQRVTANV